MRITAFFKSYVDYERLPGWDENLPNIDPQAAWQRLDHGYNEQKAALVLDDLQGVANFRGGKCLSESWDGEMFTPLDWACAFGHTFTARPFTVLKAGHWCPECESTWNGDAQ
ncbi:MAG TPA: epimerase, partial [Chloroflexi bacterium]|nr:epimerase [Chloroflexota bacterium]